MRRDDASMIDHVSLQVADVEASGAFFDAVLAPLGGRRMMDFGGVLGYGTDKPTFWLGPIAGTDAGMPREVHLAFAAHGRAQVDAFFAAAVEAGAEVLHEPKEWPQYHPNYYGAFVRDPDGNNVEAVCHSPANA
jgi:catechol 2,3-dioxygenase-like lactoylglutathione lyase family enzyme